MSFFDQAYDEMSLIEVCARLPSELAISAIKRRVNDLRTLLEFMEASGAQPASVVEIKEYFNEILSKYTTDDVFDIFKEDNHPLLFNWLNKANAEKLKNEGKAKLTRKFKFNLAGDKDLDLLDEVMTETLSENIVKQSAVLSILSKANNTIFNQLVERIIKDKRPEVRQCLLAVSHNSDLLTEHQLVVGLKALAASTENVMMIGQLLDMKLFSALKPMERLVSLEKYLNMFPTYKQIKVFSPEPSKEELEMILFSGCIEHNDLVVKLNQQYKDITETVKEEEDKSQS